MDRYHRQMLLPQIGLEGQEKLRAAKIAIVGCGALGTAAADLLARAGIGTLRLIDRDLVELTNLQRQTLFDEADVTEQTPKAVAAAGRLKRVNSSIAIDPIVADVHSGNVLSLLDGVDLILDGTDNADTRYLINDVAVKTDRPWIYGAAVGMEGRAMLIVPGRTPCLRCLFPEPPAAGELPTCDTAGVLGPVTAIVGAIQANLAIALVVARASRPCQDAHPGTGGTPVLQDMVSLNLATLRFHSMNLADARRLNCPACGLNRFDFLSRDAEASQAVLCGQSAVQVRPPTKVKGIDLKSLAQRLAKAGQVHATPFLVRCDLSDPKGLRLTVFADGRAIIHGLTDLTRARSIYARFVGL